MTSEEKTKELTGMPERQAWRVREFCVSHRISHATFYKYRALGKIRTIKIGGRVLVPASEAIRIVAEGL